MGDHAMSYIFPSSYYYKVFTNGGNTLLAIATNEVCSIGNNRASDDNELTDIKFLE